MMTSFEQVIKDLEFENESLIRQVKDEIETIDSIQNEMRLKSGENEKFVEDIEKADKEVKTLHDQIKQNKEITHSLKSAATLLQKHHEDLKKVLMLRKEDTKREHVEYERKLSEYEEKWAAYEQEYEKHPIAKEIRQYKLESADLEEKVKQLSEEKARLQETFNDLDGTKSQRETAKKEAIKSILELANIYVSGKNHVIKCKHLLSEEKNCVAKIAWKKRECTKLAAQLEERKKELARQPSWVVNKPEWVVNNKHESKRSSNSNHYPSFKPNSSPPNQSPILGPPIPTITPMENQMSKPLLQPASCANQSFAMKITTPIQAPTPNNTPLTEKTSKVNNTLNKSNTFQTLKIPSLPKMPTLPKFPSIPKFPMSPAVSTPIMKPKQLKPTSNKLQAMNKPLPKVPKLDTNTPSKCNDKNVSIEEENHAEESADTFSAPLDQPVNEYLEEKHGIVCGSAKKTPLTPSNFISNERSFSPGMHAQQLKLLKQSPGDFFQRASRPMFDAAKDPPPCDDDDKENRFAHTFSDEANFSSFDKSMISVTTDNNNKVELLSQKEEGKQNLVEPSSKKQFSFATPSANIRGEDSETSPAGKKYLTEINNQSSESDRSGFSFETAAFSPEDANFDFGGSGADFSISSENNSGGGFSFDTPSSGTKLFNNSAEQQETSSVFNFGNSATPVNSFSFDSPRVGGKSHNESGTGSPFSFSFTGNTESPKDASASDFSFNFN